MSKKYSFLFAIFSILLLSTPVFSAAPGAASMQELHQSIKDLAISVWLPRISEYALGLLYATSLIAFAIGCKDLAISGSGLQLEGVISLFARFAFLSGMMFWLLSSPIRFFFIPDSLDRLGGYIATGSASTLSFSEISSSFTNILTPIMEYYETLNWLTEPGISLTCLILIFLINCLSVLFLTTVILVRIETIFITIGGMFTAAFFVLGYFRDIFMGYIKALAMNGLKLLLLSLCINMIARLIDEWKIFYRYIDDPAIIYHHVIPMAFGLMACYVVIKSVPQYAVAILTGHASADGSLARAAVMAGVGTTATVWNVSRGISSAAVNSASTVNNAAQAYKSTAQSVKDAGGSTASARGMGAWEAVKTLMTSPIGGRSGGGRPTGSAASGGGNEMTPGGALFNDAYKAQESYDKNNGGK